MHLRIYLAVRLCYRICPLSLCLFQPVCLFSPFFVPYTSPSSLHILPHSTHTIPYPVLYHDPVLFLTPFYIILLYYSLPHSIPFSYTILTSLYTILLYCLFSHSIPFSYSVPYPVLYHSTYTIPYLGLCHCAILLVSLFYPFYLYSTIPYPVFIPFPNTP